MMMKTNMAFQELQSTWEILGDDDPCWAILSWRGKRGKWDWQEFFETGRAEIATLVGRLASMGLVPGEGPVLDFGCGVGRLTQAFADNFDLVHGVDVASSMIERARAVNVHGERVSYHVNQRTDLSIFEDSSFRLVHSHLVLQHIPTDYAKIYIREFCRILKPGGMAAFQIPCHQAVTLKTVTERMLPKPVTDFVKRTKNRQEVSMDMFGVPQSEVEAILREGSLEIVQIDVSEVPMNGWHNRWYFARKPF
jgi:ubiquinone/menaquinone biosynthesis C-methylase UbiE